MVPARRLADAPSNYEGSLSRYTRQACSFVAATTPGGSAVASNSTALTFGSFRGGPYTCNGLLLSDTVGLTTGHNLFYVALSSSFSSSDYIVVAAGALVISLS